MTFASPHDEGPLSEDEARRELCDAGRRLWEKGFVEANAGNLSYRLPGDRILATPTMIGKGHMRPEDLVVLDPTGRRLEGRRSKTSEILVHLHILKHRPDVRCVIHCHAPHATAFAIARRQPLKGIHPEAEIFVGEIPLTPYRTPGTQAVADALTPFVGRYNVFLLASHGVVAAGRGITDALWKTEIVEAYCRLLILSSSIGPPRRLTGPEVSDLLEIRKHFEVGGEDERTEY